MNLRPSGYEPDELPTAPPRDMRHKISSLIAQNQTAPITGINYHRPCLPKQHSLAAPNVYSFLSHFTGFVIAVLMVVYSELNSTINRMEKPPVIKVIIPIFIL